MKYNILKRFLDVVFALLSLILLAPLFLIIAIWIKLDSKGPVLFKQKRFGKNKKPFLVYKFRTMGIDAPKDMPTNSFLNAGQFITTSGKVLRKLSLDELPQLVNVVKGEMSLVGPRPVVLTETSLIEKRDKYNANSIKPGITGWAQVNGRDELDDDKKAQMDGYYVKNYGLAMDIKCVLKTFVVIASMAGHREGHENNQTNNQANKVGISE